MEIYKLLNFFHS